MKDRRYSNPQYRRARLYVLQRDNHECQIRSPLCTQIATEADHIIPRHKLPPGSTLFYDPHNMRAACKPCNSGRQAGLPNVTASRAW
jgi:5-methylcytosine-specific restriction endonuclease McrA